MQIRRMTLVLPARLGRTAEQDARRIAQEAAVSFGPNATGAHVRIELAGNGLSGHALTGAVGRAIAVRTGGRG